MTTTTNTDVKSAERTAAQWIADIERAAAGADAETRYVTAIAVGDHIRQGDVYIVRIADAAHGEITQDRQIAPGTTLGSRHVVEGAATIYARRTTERDPAVGPMIVATETWRLTHPEHAHYVMPAGTYQVRYQVDERTRRAVQD